MTIEWQEVEYLAAPSELGAMALAAIDQRIAAITFGYRTKAEAERAVRRTVDRIAVAGGRVEPLRRAGTGVDIAEALERLLAYAAGEPVDFSDLPIYEDHRTEFQRRVNDACRAIPRGGTSSYGEVAAAAGRPRAARAVGSVMSSNPTPLIVPCHRVLASNGRLGGYSARQGLAMKRRLLAMEANEAPQQSAMRACSV